MIHAPPCRLGFHWCHGTAFKNTKTRRVCMYCTKWACKQVAAQIEEQDRARGADELEKRKEG